jgi:cell wall-associated NlpC family hydrolase
MIGGMEKYRRTILAAALAAAVVLPAGGQTAAQVRKAIIDTAQTFKGVPYVYGAMSPSAFDCSGFVGYVYKKAAGIILPRCSKDMWAAGTPIGLAKVQTGDVLVFDTVGGAPSHVGIFIDENRMINAVSSGPTTGVIESKLKQGYFADKLLGARVFVAVADDPAPKPAAPAAAAPAVPAAQPAAPKPAAQAAPAPAPATAPAAAAPAPKSPAPAAAVPTAAAPAAPAAQPAAPKPAAPAPKPAAPELAIDYVPFTITNEAVIFTDKIPAAVGTAIQFAVTNGTGEDGVFEILFYKMDLDPAKNQTLRRDRVTIKAGGMTLVEPFTFATPGQYKLILKNHENIKRVERIWKVIEIK